MGRGKEQLHMSHQESQLGSPAYNLSAESVNDGQQLLNSSAQNEDGFCFARWMRHEEPADEGAGVEGKVLLPGVDLQGFNSLNGVLCCSEHCITPHCVECSPLSICCILEGDWSLHLGFLRQVDFGGFFLPGPLGCLRLQKEP
ncbi:uncharacterized protein LOC144007995 isoform X4 [Festucalex cinctus]